MVDRIATYAHTQSLARELMRLQSDYAAGQLQASSGLKSDNYQGIASSTQRLLSLESEYSNVASRSENSQMGLDRINGMYAAVQGMLDQVSAMKITLSASISGNVADTALQTEAEQALQSLITSLNTQQSGRYLFGGGETTTAPVDVTDPDYSDASPPSAVDTNYYQGGTYIAKVFVSDNMTVEYGTNADNAAFEKAIRAYSLIINNPSDSAAIEEAYSLLDESFNALNVIQTQLSTKATTLDERINDFADDLNLLDSMIEDIKNVDLAEVTVKLTTLETQLEASYAVTTKLLDLKLSDYL